MGRQTIGSKAKKAIHDGDSWAKHPRKYTKSRTARVHRRKAKESLKNW